MAQPGSVGYTSDDLEALRSAPGVARLELDPCRSLIVSPATGGIELAIGGTPLRFDLAVLTRQAERLSPASAGLA